MPRRGRAGVAGVSLDLRLKGLPAFWRGEAVVFLAHRPQMRSPNLTIGRHPGLDGYLRSQLVASMMATAMIDRKAGVNTLLPVARPRAKGRLDSSMKPL
jgi:hypothetical protein